MSDSFVSRIFPVLSRLVILTWAFILVACGSAPVRGPQSAESGRPSTATPGPAVERTASRWVPVPWGDLPGWGQDALHEVWSAALTNCEKPSPAYAPLCPQIRQLTLAEDTERWQWLQTHLQPYRVESLTGEQTGLLTGYYEPLLLASRLSTEQFRYPLYQTPPMPAGQKFTYPRREIDLMGESAVGLGNRQIAYLADPVDALIVHIQGSTRLAVLEPNGQRRLVRLAFAGTNDQPYQSVAKWLLDRGEIRDASWPSIKAWVAANAASQPDKVRDMFWSNPRMVFFREEALAEADAGRGPRGAQGVPLTAGRSIAVDRRSIPYGTPVWLVSNGPTTSLQKLVFAQDTGSAITGAVRADYFAGTGEDAGQLAGRLKQNLQLWALWPVDSRP